MKRSRPTDDIYEITNKKAKNSVVDDTFGLDQYGLDCIVRVWIPEGQRAKRSRRSYICIEGTINNEKGRYKSLDKFTRALRATGISNVFDVTEYINRERKRICGHETNRNQYAQTPDSFYEYMRSTMNLQLAELDPCPPNPTFDGLHPDFKWTAGADETVYVNPPFRQAGEWIQKAYQELDRGSCYGSFEPLGMQVYPYLEDIIMGFQQIQSRPCEEKALSLTSRRASLHHRKD